MLETGRKIGVTRIDVFLLFLFLLFLRPYFKLYANGTRDNVMRTVLKHCETRGRVFEYSDRLHPGTTTAREFIYHVLSRYLLPREITLESPYIFSHFHQHVEPLIVPHRGLSQAKTKDLLSILNKNQNYSKIKSINKNNNHIVIKSSNKCKRSSSSLCHL
jgi:hypothetical protein